MSKEVVPLRTSHLNWRAVSFHPSRGTGDRGSAGGSMKRRPARAPLVARPTDTFSYTGDGERLRHTTGGDSREETKRMREELPKNGITGKGVVLSLFEGRPYNKPTSNSWECRGTAEHRPITAWT